MSKAARALGILSLILLTGALGDIAAGEEERSSAELVGMGDVAFEEGRYSAAVDFYRTALEQDGENRTARLKLIGLLARLSGKESEAREEMRSALAMEGLSAEEIRLIAETARDNGFPEEAKTCYRRLLAENPGDLASLEELVGIFLAEKDLRGLHDEIDRYRASPESTLRELGAIASRCMKRSAWASAKAAYEGILKQDGKNIEALVGMGACLANAGESAEAVKVLSQAVEASPKEAQPRIALGRLLLRTGDYSSATSAFREALIIEPRSEEAGTGCAEALFSVGGYAEAKRVLGDALGVRPDSAALLTAMARLLTYTGEHESARKRLEKALEGNPGFPGAVLELGISYRETGHEDLARGQFLRLYDFYDANLSKLDSVAVGDLLDVAIGCALTDNPQDALDVLEQVLGRDPANPRALLWEARLFADRHQPQDATRELRKLLGMNPNHAEGHSLLAGMYVESYEYDLAAEQCEQALETNPNLIEALDILCFIRALDFDYENAEKAARKALDINPRSLSSLSALASCYWQEGKKDAYEEIRKKVVEGHPTCSEFYVTVARACEMKRRNEEAEKLLKEAIALSPDSVRANTMMGILLMREGEEKEAEEYLRKAYRLDQYNPKTVNFIKLLEHMEKEFVSTRTEHFLIRWDREQGRLLGQFLPAYMEEVYTEICEEFGYEPRNPTLLEIFESHDQFAGRIIGLPFIATVGASLGKIIAMDSPRAGSFDWKDVLRHEFVHVVNLQQTGMQIPFWLTEGLATLTEESTSPATWDRLRVRMLLLGEIIPVGDLNSYFTRPQTALHKQAGYAESVSICRYLKDHHGKKVIQKMIRMYGEGFSTADVVQGCLSISVEEFERTIKEHLFAEARETRIPPLFLERDGKLLAERIEQREEDPLLKVALARWLLNRALVSGRADEEILSEAEKILTRLVEKSPEAWGAYGALADVRLAKREDQRAEEAAVKALALDDEDFVARRCLGLVYQSGGESKKAIEAFEKAAELYPWTIEVWVALNMLYVRQEDREGEIRSLEGWLRANPKEIQAAKRLAQLHLADDRYDKAIEGLRRALRYAPYDADIYNLLVKAYGKNGEAEAARKYGRVGAEAAFLTAKSLMPFQKEKVIELLKLALELDPDHESSKALLGQIER